jgi:uncharacterized protein YggT (Ycf19 family)
MFKLIMLILYLVTNFFILACVARIILGWFAFSESFRMAPVERVLRLATDWWFKPFAGIGWLRRGAFDFSPAVAVTVLVLLATVFNMLASYGRIAVGVLAGIILSSLWSAVAFLLIALIILLVARLAAFVFRFNTLNPLFRAIEALSDPALFKLKRLVFGKRVVRYDVGLLGAIVPLALIALGGQWLIGSLSGLLRGLPF